MTGECTNLLQHDLAATTGIALTWRWDPQRSLQVFVDGELAGLTEPAGGDCAWLADHLQDQYIIEYLGGAWPRCIAHARHPMIAKRSDDVDLWTCPVDASISTPIGQLEPPIVEEPDVPDDHIRWWSDRWGWGVIAHSQGDIWAHFTAIQAEGFRSLAENLHVRCSVLERPQGPGFRRIAERVTVVA